MKFPRFQTTTPLHPSFKDDIKDVHLSTVCDKNDRFGKLVESWEYEIWFFSENKVIYSINNGPMADRLNYQTASYQCIRPGELWQINWLEETGTVVSLVYDIPNQTISGLTSFSKGHWVNFKAARGDKRDIHDFERWRALASEGTQTERLMLTEQARVVKKSKGKGNLGNFEVNGDTY